MPSAINVAIPCPFGGIVKRGIAEILADRAAPVVAMCRHIGGGQFGIVLLGERLNAPCQFAPAIEGLSIRLRYQAKAARHRLASEELARCRCPAAGHERLGEPRLRLQFLRAAPPLFGNDR